MKLIAYALIIQFLITIIIIHTHTHTQLFCHMEPHRRATKTTLKISLEFMVSLTPVIFPHRILPVTSKTKKIPAALLQASTCIFRKTLSSKGIQI